MFQIPKRSPQLNMCDYALWKEVDKRMRSQEKRFLPSFRESRVAFLKRLRRTAMRLPAAFINSSLKNMKVRCQRLAAAKGGHFEEGGHRLIKHSFLKACLASCSIVRLVIVATQ